MKERMIQKLDLKLVPNPSIESSRYIYIYIFPFLSIFHFIRFRFISIKWANIFLGNDFVVVIFHEKFPFIHSGCYAAHVDRGGRSAMVSGYSTRLLHRSLHLPAWVGRTTGSEADSCYRVTTVEFSVRRRLVR